ncbi:MAG: hypothetical protein AB1599_03245 [Planctomycetota bacterium]
MERVLVVERSKLLDGKEIPYGFHSEGIDGLLQNIHKFACFIDRPDAENNPALKQIIPYMVITGSDGKIFLVQRLSGQTEKRLHNKYSIGIGGHINPVRSKAPEAPAADPVGQRTSNGASPVTYLDGVSVPDIIISGLERELHEELDVKTKYKYKLAGFLNDDSNSVGQVHLGLVYQVLVEDASGVCVLEKDLMVGRFTGVSEIQTHFDLLETWSQIVFKEFICNP